jgi:hypothetical protein
LGYKWSKDYKEERKGERGRKCFAFLKRDQANEFKHNIEFKQPK